jgi:hypothetical protein
LRARGGVGWGGTVLRWVGRGLVSWRARWSGRVLFLWRARWVEWAPSGGLGGRCSCGRPQRVEQASCGGLGGPVSWRPTVGWAGVRRWAGRAPASWRARWAERSRPAVAQAGPSRRGLSGLLPWCPGGPGPVGSDGPCLLAEVPCPAWKLCANRGSPAGLGQVVVAAGAGGVRVVNRRYVRRTGAGGLPSSTAARADGRPTTGPSSGTWRAHRCPGDPWSQFP